MLGDQALKLILEARNVDATGSLKPYKCVSVSAWPHFPSAYFVLQS